VLLFLKSHLLPELDAFATFSTVIVVRPLGEAKVAIDINGFKADSRAG
jgi:hypothetical protein